MGITQRVSKIVSFTLRDKALRASLFSTLPIKSTKYQLLIS